MPVIALLANRRRSDGVFAPRHIERVRSLGAFVDARYDGDAGEVLGRLAETECLLSTWSMPRLDESLLDRLPRLRAVFYGAGSVKGFVTPAMWERGIVVSSSAPANAVCVAEYTVAVILLSNKRFWTFLRARGPAAVPGNFRRTVGIIGASHVGREVLRRLKGMDFSLMLYDPYVDAREAERLGARKADLPELMSASDVVSLHAPNLPELRHMISAGLLARLPDGATFINTARGALVDEAALVAELQKGRLFAVLDVSDPEPPAAGSPLLSLPNAVFTPHIAGAMGRECERLADFAIDELERFLAGRPLVNPVTRVALARTA